MRDEYWKIKDAELKEEYRRNKERQAEEQAKAAARAAAGEGAGGCCGGLSRRAVWRVAWRTAPVKREAEGAEGRSRAATEESGRLRWRAAGSRGRDRR
eukprot:1748895-Prymnesium_polylepis.1